MTAYQITSMMEGVVLRGTAGGAGFQKEVGKPVAGKTGTTNDEKDAWFIGFTPDLVVGVYIGFDNPSPLGHGETGGNVSAPVVRDFFKIALADSPPIPFRAPPGIKLVRVNLKTGLPAGPNDPKAIMEAFKPSEDTTATATAEGEDLGDQPAAGAEPTKAQASPGPGPTPGLMQAPPRAAMVSKQPATQEPPPSPATGLFGRIFGTQP